MKRPETDRDLNELWIHSNHTIKLLNIRTPEKMLQLSYNLNNVAPTISTMWLFHRVMRPKDAGRIANSVDPDQTARLGAVWSGSTLFAQWAYLSENVGSLRYVNILVSLNISFKSDFLFKM